MSCAASRDRRLRDVQSRLGAARVRRGRRAAVRDRRPRRPRRRRPHRAARVSARSPTRCATCGRAGSTRRWPSRCGTKGAPFLGVCLGMQLMAAIGEEVRDHRRARVDRRALRALRADRDRPARAARRLERGDAVTRLAALRRHPARHRLLLRALVPRGVRDDRAGARDHAVLRRLRVGRAARAGLRRAVPSREEPALGLAPARATSWRS